MGEIDQKYAEPGVAALLGAPLAAETAATDAGRLRRYDRGMITSHRRAGAHAVHGEIAAAYLASGGPGGPLGYPIRGQEAVWGRRGGSYQDFMEGQIYWQPELGAHAVSGGIFEKFLLQDALGGAGYPIGGRHIEDDGTVRQDFEHLTLWWNPDLGAGSRSRRQPAAKLLRVIPVAFRDIPPPPGMSKAFLEAYFFGRGIDLRMPDGRPVTESLAEYFARISGGLIALEGVVEEWYLSARDCHTVAHWTHGGTWPPGDAGLTGEFADAMRAARIRDASSLRVHGRAVDGVYFLHTDMLSNGGATRTFADFRRNLEELGRLDLWDPGWDGIADLAFCTSGVTLQERQNINPLTSRFDEAPRPGEIVHAPQSTVRHELMHVLGPFGGDIYGEPWRFHSTWHEVMGDVVRSDGPIGITSLVGERLGFMSPTNVPRRSVDGFELPELESQRVAARFPNGPRDDPEYLVLEHRRRYDLAHPESPRMANGIVAYAIDPRGRMVVDTAHTNSSGESVHRGVRVSGGLIRRNHSWGSAFGVDPKGRMLTGDGPFDRNTLNHAGEAWWAFGGLTGNDRAAARVSVRYLADDLLGRYDGARWTAGTGAVVVRTGPALLGGSVVLHDRSSAVAPTGERLGRALELRPSTRGAVTGTFAVSVPAAGARLYLSAAVDAFAADTPRTEVLVTVASPKSASRGPVELARLGLDPDASHRTLVVDLNAYAGRQVRLGITAGPPEGKSGGVVLITEASVVPTARVLVDLLSALDAATFRAGPRDGVVALGEGGGALGAARRDRQVDLHDGRRYAGTSLHLHPQWEPDGWVEAAWPVTLPNVPAVLRMHAGFDTRRAVVENGVRVSIRFDGPVGSVTLLGDSLLERGPTFGHRGGVRNRGLVTAIPIPAELRSRTGRIRVRVDADGHSGEDWFHLVSARITAN